MAQTTPDGGKIQLQDLFLNTLAEQWECYF